MLTNVGASTNISLPNKGTPKVAAVLGRPPARVRAALMLGVGYTGLTGTDLDWQARHQHQPARSEIPDRSSPDTLVSVPNPFLRRRGGGPVRARADDRARPAAAAVSAVRRRAVDRRDRRALAVSRAHLPGTQAHRQPVGRQLQLHVQPPDGQPGRREQLLLERAWRSEQLRAGALVELLQPGLGIRAQPARLAAQDHHLADAAAAVRRGQEVPLQQRRRRRACSAAGRSPAWRSSRAASRWASART